VNLPLRTRDGETVDIAFRANVDRSAVGHISPLIHLGQ
jgi:hypothetical protein